jgi:glycosyltransferase involved in cell wall biosynthesis
MWWRFAAVADSKDMNQGVTADAKAHVLFVSAFPGVQKANATGGQLYATTTLLASPISNRVAWIPLNTALETLPPPPVYRRALPALRRVATFWIYLLTRQVDAILIFASNGSSTLEKGLMAWLGKLHGKRVTYCPRSGLILNDLERNGWLARITRAVLRRVDVVLCQSERWKTVFQRETGLPDTRFVVIQNWIDSTPYLSCEPPASADPLVVLYLGWVETYKGIFDLISAISDNRDALRNVHVAVCGAGSQLAMAKQRVAELKLNDRFEFHGWVDSATKLDWLKRANIFVLPSHFEGMPNALMEAMASGRACIATAVGGVPDLLCAPSLGRVVPPKDPVALGAALTELAGDPALRDSLGANARARILANNDIRNSYLRVYRAVVANGADEPRPDSDQRIP